MEEQSNFTFELAYRHYDAAEDTLVRYEQEKTVSAKKQKPISGASKRFKRTGSGGYKRKSSHLRHILTKKSAKRKRHLRGSSMVHDSDVVLIKRMLPNDR